MSTYIKNGDSALEVRTKLNSGLLVPSAAEKTVIDRNSVLNITAPDDSAYIYFTAPSDYSSTDKVMVNGTYYTLMSQYNQQPIDAWSSGAFVEMLLDKENGIAYVVDVPCYTKTEMLTSGTSQLFGLTSSSTPDAVFRKIYTLLGEKAAIMTGSYTGTNTVGKSNPNQITFPFTPYFIAVYDTSSSNPSFIIRGCNTFYTWTSFAGGGRCNVEFSGKTVKWYCSDKFRWDYNGSTGYYSNEPYLQLNKNQEYYYFAVGA